MVWWTYIVLSIITPFTKSSCLINFSTDFKLPTFIFWSCKVEEVEPPERVLQDKKKKIPTVFFSRVILGNIRSQNHLNLGQLFIKWQVNIWIWFAWKVSLIMAKSQTALLQLKSGKWVCSGVAGKSALHHRGVYWSNKHTKNESSFKQHFQTWQRAPCTWTKEMYDERQQSCK